MRILLVLLALFLVTGCTPISRPISQTAVYDFGMAASPEPKHLDYRFAGITATAELGNSDIRYRLAYKDSARVYRYAESRWLASPATLLDQRLRQRAIFDNTGNATCTLSLELMAFDQVFDTPNTSRGVIRLHAMLTRPDKRIPPEYRELALEKASDTPDARGGVIALAAATDEAISQLIDWIVGMDCRP